MVRVMVVEDEPAAMGYITMLLQTRCPDVEVVCRSEDGRAAIEALTTTQVDIVITDIQMADVDGIELAQWISQNKPNVLTIIVSGFSDFEYAKGAIRAGVAEYLLKPIRPSEFEVAMKKWTCEAKGRKREAREKWLIQRLKTGGAYDFRLWQEERLLLGVVRQGGVLREALVPSEHFPYPLNLPEDLVATYARDEMEICFAVPCHDRQNTDRLADSLSFGAPYYTALVKTISIGEVCDCLPGMLDTALKIAVPGMRRTKEYVGGSAAQSTPHTKELTLVKNLRYAIANSQLEKIKIGLSDLFALWESEHCCLSHVEPTLAHLLQHMTDYAPANEKLGASTFDIATMICRQASSYSDMLRKTWEYCGVLYKPLEHRDKGGQLINRIENYIQEHLSDPLSIQIICDVFGISGSYLCQLFRKYRKLTFVDYVTERRIEEAKRLMNEYPDMPIKTIAGQLGFADQFYFSKVFRAMTGVAPSEFRATAVSGACPQHRGT